MEIAIIIDLENSRTNKELLNDILMKIRNMEIPIGLSFEPIRSKSILNLLRNSKVKDLVEFIPTIPYGSDLNFMNNEEANMALSLAKDIVQKVVGSEPRLLMLYHQLIIDPDQLEIAKDIGFRGAVVNYEIYRYLIPQLRLYRILKTQFDNSEFLLIYAQKYIPRALLPQNKIILILNIGEFLENINILSKKFNIKPLAELLEKPEGKIDLISMGTSLFGKEFHEVLIREPIKEVELLRILSRIKKFKNPIASRKISKLIMKILSKEYKILVFPGVFQDLMKDEKIEVINPNIELNMPFISEVRVINIDENLVKSLAFISHHDIVGDFLRVEKIKGHNIGIASIIIPRYKIKGIIEVKPIKNKAMESQVYVISDWLFTNSTEVRLSNSGLPLSVKAGTAFIDLGCEAFYTLIVTDNGSEFSEVDVSTLDFKYGKSFLGLAAWSYRRSGVGDTFVETEVRIFSKVPVIEIIKKVNVLTEFNGYIYILTIPIPPYLSSITRLSCKEISSIKITSAEAIVPTLNSVIIDMGYGYLAIVSNAYSEPTWSIYVNKAKGYLSLGVFRSSFQRPLTGIKYARFFIYTTSSLEEVKNFVYAFTNPPLIKPVPRFGVIDLYISHTSSDI